MKYSINRENYHRFDILEIGKLPPRSYFIPFPNRISADSVTIGQKRYASSKVQCLNGQWDFLFYPNPKDVPLILDTEDAAFDTIDVPSCVVGITEVHVSFFMAMIPFPLGPVGAIKFTLYLDE